MTETIESRVYRTHRDAHTLYVGACGCGWESASYFRTHEAANQLRVHVATHQPGARDCQARRYGRNPCTDTPDFDIVYRSSNGAELDRHSACFTHGLAEVERHHASAGMATVIMEKPGES